MTQYDAQLYAAILMADHTRTTCQATFDGSDKPYVYQIDKELAAQLSPGDKLIVDHNTNDKYHMVTLVNVDVIPSCGWSHKTRSVLSAIRLDDLQDAREDIAEERDALYSAAKAHLDNKAAENLRDAQAEMQEQLGVASFFS